MTANLNCTDNNYDVTEIYVTRYMTELVVKFRSLGLQGSLESRLFINIYLCIIYVVIITIITIAIIIVIIVIIIIIIITITIIIIVIILIINILLLLFYLFNYFFSLLIHEENDRQLHVCVFG